MLARIADGAEPTTPEDLGAVMTLCRNRGAEDMRERCAKVAADFDVDDEAARYGIAHAILALPLTPAEPSQPPLCVPGCVRRETDGAGHPDARREAVVVPANDGGKAKV